MIEKGEMEGGMKGKEAREGEGEGEGREKREGGNGINATQVWKNTIAPNRHPHCQNVKEKVNSLISYLTK